MSDNCGVIAVPASGGERRRPREHTESRQGKCLPGQAGIIRRWSDRGPTVVSEREGSRLKGVATIALMGLNLVFWVVPLLLVAVLKLVVPIAARRQWARPGAHGAAG